MPKPITQNTLFYGDNLSILRACLPDEIIGLSIQVLTTMACWLAKALKCYPLPGVRSSRLGSKKSNKENWGYDD